MTVFLSDPDVRYKQEFYDMLAEWKATGEELVPWVLDLDSSDFDRYVSDLKNYSLGIALGKGKVPHSTYWLIDEGRLVGVSNFRHELNEKLLASGGNIGYGIRPSARRKGYATLLLKLTLEKAREMGLKRVLLVCHKGNIGSAKTIINNGGVLENEPLIDGRIEQRYWIEL